MTPGTSKKFQDLDCLRLFDGLLAMNCGRHKGEPKMDDWLPVDSATADTLFVVHFIWNFRCSCYF